MQEDNKDDLSFIENAFIEPTEGFSSEEDNVSLDTEAQISQEIKTDKDTDFVKNHDQSVPLATFQQEREERKRWRDEAAQLKGQLSLVMDSLREMNAADHSKKEEKEYNPKTHPLEYIQQQMGRLNEAREQMEAYTRQQQIEREQQQIAQHVSDSWEKAVEEQKALSPDIEDATKYLIDARSKQLGILGLNKHQIQNQLRNEMIHIVSQGNQMGVNPAGMVFELAKSAGYRSSREETIAQTTERIKKAEQARGAMRTLASTPGVPSPDEMTLEDLEKMSETELNKWINKNPVEFEKMMASSL